MVQRMHQPTPPTPPTPPHLLHLIEQQDPSESCKQKSVVFTIVEARRNSATTSVRRCRHVEWFEASKCDATLSNTIRSMRSPTSDEGGTRDRLTVGPPRSSRDGLSRCQTIRSVRVAAFVHVSLAKHAVQDDGVQSNVDVPEDPAPDNQDWPNKSTCFSRGRVQTRESGVSLVRRRLASNQSVGESFSIHRDREHRRAKRRHEAP